MGVREMVHPWRKGKALVFPWRPFKGLALGLWKRQKQIVDPDFEDEQWLAPRQLNVPISEISGWDNGEEETLEEEVSAEAGGA